jgi:hypothetical protein
LRIPTLTKLYQMGSVVTWKAQFAPARDGQGMTYRVVTREGSGDMRVTSWVRCRVITGERLLEQIRMGLKHAEPAA